MHLERVNSHNEMGTKVARSQDDKRAKLTGCDEPVWSWKRVNHDINTVVGGRSTLAENAVRARSDLAKLRTMRSRNAASRK